MLKNSLGNSIDFLKFLFIHFEMSLLDFTTLSTFETKINYHNFSIYLNHQ